MSQIKDILKNTSEEDDYFIKDIFVNKIKKFSYLKQARKNGAFTKTIFNRFSKMNFYFKKLF